MTDEIQKLRPSFLNPQYPIGVLPSGKVKSMQEYPLPGSLAADFSAQLSKKYSGAQTQDVMNKIRAIEKNTLSTSDSDDSDDSENIYEKIFTIEEQIFDARAGVKILFSKVSMHFSNELRDKLFHQIDLLHELSDWEEGEEPVQLQSFNTFLRWYYLNKPQRLPSFGLSSTGHFIASWLTNQNKDTLILEFLSSDRIKWFVTKYYGEDADHSSGTTRLSRIMDVLTPFQVDAWFDKGV